MQAKILVVRGRVLWYENISNEMLHCDLPNNFRLNT